MTGPGSPAGSVPTARAFWDGFYAGHSGGDAGRVNRNLVAEVVGLPPGRALDVGCGEGWDALWLAEQGWDVVGVDVSGTALERARATAERRGLTSRARFTRHDVGRSLPTGTFDLISAQFLHNPVARPGEREAVLRRAAGAVAAGGHLLVVSHAGMPAWHTGMPDLGHPVDLTVLGPAEVRTALDLSPRTWVTVRDEVVAEAMTGPHGEPGERLDHVLHVRRAPA